MRARGGHFALLWPGAPWGMRGSNAHRYQQRLGVLAHNAVHHVQKPASGRAIAERAPNPLHAPSGGGATRVESGSSCGRFGVDPRPTQGQGGGSSWGRVGAALASIWGHSQFDVGRSGVDPGSPSKRPSNEPPAAQESRRRGAAMTAKRRRWPASPCPGTGRRRYGARGR